MSESTPETPPARKLTQATDDVMAQLAAETAPPASRGQQVLLAGIMAFIFGGLPAFIVFAVTSLVVPSVTNDAGIGTVALWALQFAVLLAVVTMITTALRPEPTSPDPDESAGRAMLRLARNALITAACAVLVLVVVGLTAGGIVTLTLLLVLALHVLPTVVARGLRRRRPRQEPPAAGPHADARS